MLYAHLFDYDEMHFLTRYLETADNFLDVGANIGLTVIPIAAAGSIRCFAFEPEPSNFLLLRKNMLANGVDGKVTAYPYALFSRAGDFRLELSASNMGDHRLLVIDDGTAPDRKQKLMRRKIISVPARRLDDVLGADGLTTPIALKIDVQGSEAHVLRGASQFLRHVDYLFVEVWPEGLCLVGDSLEGLLAQIRNFPYAVLYPPDQDSAVSWRPELRPSEHVLEELRLRATGPLESDYCDLFLSRHQLDTS